MRKGIGRRVSCFEEFGVIGQGVWPGFGAEGGVLFGWGFKGFEEGRGALAEGSSEKGFVAGRCVPEVFEEGVFGDSVTGQMAVASVVWAVAFNTPRAEGLGDANGGGAEDVSDLARAQVHAWVIQDRVNGGVDVLGHEVERVEEVRPGLSGLLHRGGLQKVNADAARCEIGLSNDVVTLGGTIGDEGGAAELRVCGAAGHV